MKSEQHKSLGQAWSHGDQVERRADHASQRQDINPFAGAFQDRASPGMPKRSMPSQRSAALSLKQHSSSFRFSRSPSQQQQQKQNLQLESILFQGAGNNPYQRRHRGRSKQRTRSKTTSSPSKATTQLADAIPSPKLEGKVPPLNLNALGSGVPVKAMQVFEVESSKAGEEVLAQEKQDPEVPPTLSLFTPGQPEEEQQRIYLSPSQLHPIVEKQDRRNGDQESNKFQESIKFNVTFRNPNPRKSTKSSKKGGKIILDSISLPRFNEEFNLNDISLNEINLGQNTPDLFVADGNIVGEDYLCQGSPSGRFLSSNYENLESDSSVSRNQLGKIVHLQDKGATKKKVMQSSLTHESPIKVPARSSPDVNTEIVEESVKKESKPKSSAKSSNEMQFDDQTEGSSRKTEKTQQSKAPTIQEIELEDADRELEKLGEPFWLTNQFVNRPFCVIIFGLGIIMAFAFFCVYYKTYWPSPVTSRDLLDYTHPNTVFYDTRQAAQAEIQERSSPNGSIPLQSITNQELWLQIGIECVKDKYGDECDNVLNPRGLQLLHEIDAIIEEDETWQKICLRQSQTNSSCAAETSIGGKISKASPLLIFQQVFGDEVTELTQYAIDLVLFGLARSDANFNYTVPFFSKEYSKENRKAKLVRILLIVAGPIEINGVRYKNMGDRWPEQEYEIAQWQIELNEKIMKLVEEEYQGFQVHSFGRAYAYRWFYDQLLFDVLWSGLSILLVGLLITYHTKSIFVSMTSMTMILFSFPITLVIYRKIFMVTNVSSLHLMILFVVLGISADNIFVIWDAFRQSDTFPQLRGNYEKRMAYMFRRASKSLLATSSTTAFAFMSNGFSSLMPVSAFGWFAFIVIPVNYILIMMYYPAYLIVYDKYVKEMEKKAVKCAINLVTCKLVRSLKWRKLIEILKGDREGFIERNNDQTEMSAMDGKSKYSTSEFDFDETSGRRVETILPQYTDKSEDVDQSIVLQGLYEESASNKGSKPRSMPKPIERRRTYSKQYQKRNCQSEHLQYLGNFMSQTMDLEGGRLEADEENITEESNEQHSHMSVGITQSNILNLDTTHNHFLQNYSSKDPVIDDQLDLEDQVRPNLQSQNIKQPRKANNRRNNMDFRIDESAASQSNRLSLKKRQIQSAKETKRNRTGGLESLLKTQKSRYSRRISRSEKSNHLDLNAPNLSRNNSTAHTTAISATSTKTWKDEAIEQLGPVEIFFDTHFMSFISRCKCILILMGLLSASYAGYRATEIQGLSKMEDIVKEDHYVYQAFDRLVFDFHDGDQGQSIVVDFVWGTNGLNKTGVDYYNASQIGSAIWDDQFDLSQPENQQSAYNFCQLLKTQEDLLFASPANSVSCWLDDFKRFIEAQGLKFPLVMPKDHNLVAGAPAQASGSPTHSQAALTPTEQTELSLDQAKEAAIWTQKRYFSQYLLRYVTETAEGQEQLSQNVVGIIDGALAYMKIQVKSAGGIYDPYVKKNPIKLKWDEVLDEFNSNAPEGINRAIQTAGLDWCWIITEIKLVETMKQGLQISIGFALIALLLVTQNLFMAVYASLTIGLIVVNVLGIIPYMGWQLGSSESVGVVVCVGFAVDYVVHLASHYVHSTYKHRHDRTKESLREMGISILSGSLTTMLASAVLFLCVIITFYKFAIFVISTVLFAIFYSLFFFAALCDLAGPNGEHGSFIFYYRMAAEKIKYIFFLSSETSDEAQGERRSEEGSKARSEEIRKEGSRRTHSVASARNADRASQRSGKASAKGSRRSRSMKSQEGQHDSKEKSNKSRSLAPDERPPRSSKPSRSESEKSRKR